jgi:hypothetical protein
MTITTDFDLCPICNWEHDPAQELDPDGDVGANRLSLRAAQSNFSLFGACEIVAKGRVRPTLPNEKVDPDWRPISEKTRKG